MGAWLFPAFVMATVHSLLDVENGVAKYMLSQNEKALSMVP